MQNANTFLFFRLARRLEKFIATTIVDFSEHPNVDCGHLAVPDNRDSCGIYFLYARICRCSSDRLHPEALRINEQIVDCSERYHYYVLPVPIRNLPRNVPTIQVHIFI